MSVLARRAPRILLAVVLAALTLVGIAMVGMTTSVRANSARPAADTPAQPPPPASSDGDIVVAVVLGRSPTVGSDALAPYEVFATSPMFSVYTVAESPAPAPIGGGPALVPTHTFADVDSGAAPTPDVVVVPAVGDPTGEQEAPLRAWITRQAEGGAHVFGVCSGSTVLAATGLLDGRRATSHWSGIDALADTHPEVQWLRGERYVQDGPITTTAGVTSGIPGALEVMRDLAGPAEAERVGRVIDYPGWSPDAPSTITDHDFALSDLPVGLALLFPWFRPTVGIGLTDGVSEIDLAAAFEVHTTAHAASTVAVAAGDRITTRHGVVVLTDSTEAVVDDVDRLIVPGAAETADIEPQLRQWATDRAIDIKPLHARDGRLGFDAALEDLAAHTDRGTALTVAKVIDYPTEHLTLPDHGRSWRAPTLLAASLLIAVGIGTSVAKALRHRSRR